MTKSEIIKLLETDYLLGVIDIAEVKRRLGFNPSQTSVYVFTELGIYNEFKKIQNKRRGLSAKKTNIKRYGVANGHNELVKDKIKQTSLAKYGTENPWQAESIKSKSRKTKIVKYGDPTYTNRQKCKETMQSKYGVDNCSQLGDWDSKVRETKFQKYGSATYNNSTKMKQTKLSKIQQYELNNNVVSIKMFTNKYGDRCYSTIERLNIPVKYYCDRFFIPIDSVDLLITYLDTITPGSGKSYKELDIANFIKSFYNGPVKLNDRKAIRPKEIDIFLPELRIGIEYNGSYWHCTENGTSKELHLKKSLLCRNKGIRLIHIYEFENFEEQKQLLKALILGTDNYSEDDFNKNNLTNTIPRAEVIYKDNNYTIYGAGKLIQSNSLYNNTLVEVKD